MEEGWNYFRKTICEVADGVLGKKVRNAACNIRETALCLIVRRRGLYKNYLSDKSYDINNIRNEKKVENTGVLIN